MKQIIILIAIGIVIAITGYIALGYLSSYIGWDGYRKWEHRVGTSRIEDAKKRGVFVKELKFTVENYAGSLGGFRPYIERGFKYGRHTSEETVPLTGSDYPYKLSFNKDSISGIGFLIRDSSLWKFDSADACWGYLRTPELKDTILVDIAGEHIPRGGFIKVYQ